MKVMQEYFVLDIREFISDKHSEKPGISVEDIPVSVNGLGERGIRTVQRSRCHLLLVDHLCEEIVDEASTLYAQRHSLDPVQNTTIR